MTKNEKSIYIRLTKDVHQKLRLKAFEAEKSIQKIVEELIKKDVENGK